MTDKKFGNYYLHPISIHNPGRIHQVKDVFEDLSPYKVELANLVKECKKQEICYFALPKIGIMFNAMLEVYQSLTSILTNLKYEEKSRQYIRTSEKCMCMSQPLILLRADMYQLEYYSTEFSEWTQKIGEKTRKNREHSVISITDASDMSKILKLHEIDHAVGSLHLKEELSRTLLEGNVEEEKRSGT